jgi:hypothetical protein
MQQPRSLKDFFSPPPWPEAPPEQQKRKTYHTPAHTRARTLRLGWILALIDPVLAGGL